MKRTLVTLAGMLLLGLGMASAQIVRPLQFTMNQPFYAQGAQLPAGAYRIVQTPDDVNILEIEPLTESKGAFLFTIPKWNVEIPASSGLTFNKYGDRLFLESIVLEGSGDAAELPQSRAEKRAMKGSEPEARIWIPAAPAHGRS